MARFATPRNGLNNGMVPLTTNCVDIRNHAQDLLDADLISATLSRINEKVFLEAVREE